MTRKHAPAAAAVDDIQALLPWYLNGTLDPDQAALVERHLAEDPSLRAELAMSEELNQAVQADNDAIPAPPLGDFDRVMSRIQQEDRTGQIVREQQRLGFWQTLRTWLLPTSPVAMRAAMALGAAVIVLQFAAIAGLVAIDGADPAGYQTVIQPPSGTDPVTSYPQVIIIFQQSATAGTMQETFDLLEGNVVSGPSGQGAYVVEVQLAVASAEEFDRLLDQARSRANVVQFIGKAQ